MSNNEQQPRPIFRIAREIENEWKNVFYGARPYLDVLHTATKVTDIYIFGSHDSTVRGFLANASTFRGERARELKQELKDLLNK